MKLFLKYIIKIVLLLIISAYFLDFFYSKIYDSSKDRNKIQAVINGNKKNLDVLVLGSSRANNHFVTSEFEKVNCKAFNFGMSGSTLEETALMLELIVERKWVVKNILLEVDLNVNSESYSEGTRAFYMPYLNNSTIASYYNSIDNFSQVNFIPFYRFVTFETKIGFREMFFSLIKKKTNSLQNGGFYPLTNIGKNMSYDLTKYSPKENKNYKRIKNICRKNKINLIVVSTPMCENTTNREYFKELKKMYPEINSFENVVTEDKYFSSCGHMNVDGATIYTKKVIEFLKVQKSI